MYRFDPRQFDLGAWGRWVASGRPIHFSMLGNSLCGQPFMPQHKRTYRDDSCCCSRKSVNRGGFYPGLCRSRFVGKPVDSGTPSQRQTPLRRAVPTAVVWRDRREEAN